MNIAISNLKLTPGGKQANGVFALFDCDLGDVIRLEGCALALNNSGKVEAWPPVVDQRRGKPRRRRLRVLDPLMWGEVERRAAAVLLDQGS